MSHCPSQDYDRYINELDDAAAERMKVCSQHKQKVWEVYTMLLRHTIANDVPVAVEVRRELLDTAEQVVADWHYRTTPEE